MTTSDFIKKYIGKQVDFDGHYGAQCVDLYRQYLKDMWYIEKTEPVIGAKHLWLNYENTKLQKAALKKTESPKAGDIVIFGNGKYGHVAIYLGHLDDSNIIVFQQDGFNQSIGAHLAIMSTKNIIGFLQKS